MTIQEQIITYAKTMLADNFVTATWGNISMLDGEIMYITPSGRDYRSLISEDIAQVLFPSGQVKTGYPSTELFLHNRVYAMRNDIAAIVHVHSVNLSAVSALGLSIPALTEDQAMLIGERIAVAPYAPAGSELLATRTAEYLGLNDGVMLANHGYVACGRTIAEAYNNCRIAEKAAQIFLLALSTGKTFRCVPQEDARSLRDYYLSDYRLRQNQP